MRNNLKHRYKWQPVGVLCLVVTLILIVYSNSLCFYDNNWNYVSDSLILLCLLETYIGWLTLRKALSK